MTRFTLLLVLLTAFAVEANPRCRAIEDTLALARAERLDTGSLDALANKYCGWATRGRSGAVELFHSDVCSGQPTAVVGPRTRCEALGVTTPVWAIRVGGQCIDAKDVPFAEGCESFKRAARSTMTLHRSDICRGGLVAAIGQRTECATLDSRTTNAWAISVAGQCFNIPDTSPRAACEAYRYGPPGG